MPTWLELVLLAFASMFWPTLIVIVVLALRVSHPIKILAWFLAGGLLTTISVGIVIVFELQGSSLVSGSSPSIDPPVYITMGLLSLLAAFALLRKSKQAPAKPRHEAKAPSADAKPPLTERAVGHGAPVAFAAGVVLNILPGTFPIVALKDIARGGRQ